MKPALLFLLCSLPALLSAQHKPPREGDYETLHYYKDSMERHENPVLKYHPHRCQNRYAKYGWVGKNHSTIIPFEYDQLPERLVPLMSAVKNNQHGAIDSTGKTIVPFRYAVANISLDQQRIYAYAAKSMLCGAWDSKGKQIIPEKYNNMSDFKDSLIRAYDPQAHQIVMFTKQGKKVFSIDYQVYWEMAPGRYGACRDSSSVMLCGVIDANQQVIVPLSYNQVSWVRQNWAAVSESPATRGLFHIPSQQFKSFPDYTFGMPDAYGNLNFNNNPAGWDTHHGLMDSTLRVIYQPDFYAIRSIDGVPNYILTTASQRSGVGDAHGNIILDTLYGRFVQAKVAKDRSHTASIQYEFNLTTLPFWHFGERSREYPPRFAGLWHNKQGLICLPNAYDQMFPLSDHLYMACKSDTCLLRSIDGQIHSKSYKKVVFFQNRLLFAQLDGATDYDVIDLDGKVLSTIPALPEELGNGFLAIRRKDGYALFDETLKMLTDYKYLELRSLFFLEDRYQDEMIRKEGSKGYSQWVAWAKETLRGELILLDSKGKAYKIHEK